MVGLNYHIAGYTPTLILDNQGGKKPDLIVHYSREHEVYVECVSRMPKPERTLDLAVLVDDLICKLKEKKESKEDWGGSRVVAIHIPEEIDWTDSMLRRRIGTRVYREFERHEENYRNVNAVVFSSDRIPPQIKNVTSTDIPCLMFLNLGNTKYQLPPDFHVAGE